MLNIAYKDAQHVFGNAVAVQLVVNWDLAGMCFLHVNSLCQAVDGLIGQFTPMSCRKYMRYGCLKWHRLRVDDRISYSLR